MGKITVNGNAEHEYTADICQMKLDINVRRETAFEASRVSSEQCEMLLSDLQEMGVELDKIEVATDAVKNRTSVYAKETGFDSQKTLSMYSNGDIHVVNAIRDLIESGYTDVSFSVNYKVSNESELRKLLLKDAIAKSRLKAELLAETMGASIDGIDSAEVFDNDNTDLMECLEQESIRPICGRGAGAPRLRDQLKPPKVRLSVSVKIVWLLSE